MSTDGHQTDSPSSRWRGIFVIPVTPFDEDGDLDLDSLRQELDFCIEAGVHGIVYPVMASEFFTLSDKERLRVISVMVKHVAKRVPTVAGVAGVSTQAAVRFARTARDVGADAVIAMPPYVTRYSSDDTLRYYEAIAAAAQVPVFIQNAGLAPVSLPLMTRLVREVEHVHYIKEEVAPAHHNIRKLVALAEPEVWGVFGGGGGQNIVDELARGAVGNMPAPHFADVLVRIFDLFQSGDHDEARRLHMRLMPGLNRERLSGVAFGKVALVRRGVIRCARTRSAGTPLDDYDYKEIDALWPNLAALFTVRGSSQCQDTVPAT